MKKFFIASMAAVVVFAAQAKADNILFYSFNTNGFAGGVSQLPANTFTNYVTTANVDVNGGSTFSSFNSAGSALTLLSSVTGNPNNHGFPAGNSISQNNWIGDASYFQFTVNATGYQNLIVGWAGNRSSTGPTNMVLRYSGDGGANFADVATFAALTNVGTNFDLSSFTTLNGNAGDVFRLVGLNAGAAAGTIKIDNFSIDATAVPEPSTVMLVVGGLVGMMAMRRRRS